MSSQNNGFTDEELKMIEEMESVIAEVKKHPEIMSMPLPENLHRELWRDIREYNEEKAKAASVVPKEPEPEVSRLSDEEKELIQLGKIYKRRKKNRKFYVLIAAVIGAMTLGITSMGGPEKVFERFNWMLAGREQTNIDSESDNIKKMDSVAEEEIYQQIEEEYGFWPVQFGYLPDGILFYEGTIYEDIQEVQMLFGCQDTVNITYMMYPNYREGSLGIDIEDVLLEEYTLIVEGNSVIVKNYMYVKENEERWSAEFSYGNVRYFINGIDFSKQEFEKILENLYFS